MVFCLFVVIFYYFFMICFTKELGGFTIFFRIPKIIYFQQTTGIHFFLSRADKNGKPHNFQIQMSTDVVTDKMNYISRIIFLLYLFFSVQFEYHKLGKTKINSHTELINNNLFLIILRSGLSLCIFILY